MEAVLKALKSNKARDPLGLVNELFQLKNIGEDLKIALLKFHSFTEYDYQLTYHRYYSQTYQDNFKTCLGNPCLLQLLNI